MNTLMVRFWNDDEGAEMVEWAVVTITLLLLTVVAIILIKDELIQLYQDAFTAIQSDPPDTYFEGA